MQQHTIPACYLRAWLEPVTPTGQNAAIWRIPVSNLEPGEPYRRSPEKSFRIAERFTVHFEDGTKSYHVEQGLGQLENDYTKILQHVRRGEQLSVMQRLKLAAFTGAMMGRSKKISAHMATQINGMADKTEAIERFLGIGNIKSDDMRKWAAGVAPELVTESVRTATPVLFLMESMVLRTDDDLGFITSDAPFVMHDPESHKSPPGSLRSPGLLTKTVEIMLPITPQHLLFYRHGIPSFRYVDINRQTVDEANRNQVFHAGEQIVSWKGLTRPAWFEKRELPADAWENSPGGKSAMEAVQQAEKGPQTNA